MTDLEDTMSNDDKNKPLTPEQLAELRRIAEGATPGPWRANAIPEPEHGSWVAVGPQHFANEYGFDPSLAAQADAAHIAAFDPPTVLRLLDMVERQRERLECISAHDIRAQLAVVRDAVAKAVAEEREACERIAVAYAAARGAFPGTDGGAAEEMAKDIAVAIRARGGDR